MSSFVHEQHALHLTLDFADGEGNPLKPKSVEWQLLTDMEDGRQLVGWTTAEDVSSHMDLTIEGVHHILGSDARNEGRVLLVRTDHGSSGEAHQQFEYQVVKNGN